MLDVAARVALGLFTAAGIIALFSDAPAAPVVQGLGWVSAVTLVAWLMPAPPCDRPHTDQKGRTDA